MAKPLEHAVPVSQIVTALRRAGLLDHVAGPADIDVYGCTVDSREVEPGNLFFCKGAHFKPAFLGMALDKGATCFIADASLEQDLLAQPHAQHAVGIFVNNVRLAMAVAAPLVYEHPSDKLTVVGITGTKGKTTAAYMLRSILQASGVEPGMLGSILTDDGIESYESHNTTPEAPELWRHLDNVRASGRKAMVMEVSSQALKYDRTKGLHLDIACFLNIGRDHISAVEHPDFEDYFTSKLRIFDQCTTAVVNLGSDNADRVLNAAQSAERVITTTADPTSTSASVCVADVVAKDGRISFTALLAPELSETGRVQKLPIKLGISGLFNVDNALAAIAMARLMSVPTRYIVQGLAELHIPGRMEVVRSHDDKVVSIIDFAHNELSFKALLSSVRKEYPGRFVISVFGAPGDKAMERREQLPRAAAPYSNLIILTEDDPGHEDVRDICKQLVSNLPQGTNYELVYDREDAAERAFVVARDHAPAVVMLLAKGHETCQHRGDGYEEIRTDLQLAKDYINGYGANDAE